MNTKYSKKIILILVIALPLFTLAQDDNDLKSFYIKKAKESTVEQIRLDFSVPDIPAFKALGNDPSNILRPSSAKDLAFMIGSFRSSGNFLIPKNFSLEIAPGLLLKPWYRLEDYQQKAGIRFLTKLRISAGSDANDATGINSLAAGIRMTFLDKGDFRKDTTFLKTEIFDKQDKYTNAWKKYRDEIMVERGLTPSQYDALSQANKDDILNEAKEKVGFDLDLDIANALKEYKKTHWNESRIDFAYAILSKSPDSLLAKIKTEKHSFWLAIALKPWKNNTWGQFLFGINNNVVKNNDKFYNEFSGNFRFYVGANRVKGFLEAQYQNLDNSAKRKETLYSQIGIEVAIYKSIWIHFGTGVLNALNGSAKSELQSNLNLYLSFPENFKLF